MQTRKTVIIVVSAFLLLMVVAVIGGALNGRELFNSKGCLNCHSFQGRGGSVGPDLTAVSKRRSTFWIMEQIRAPRKHNPNSMMPEFDDLSIIDRFAVAEYLKSGA